MPSTTLFSRPRARGPDLRDKSRRRRETLAAIDAAPTTRAPRNDLLPRLAMAERAIEDLRPPARNVRPPDPAHVRAVAASIATRVLRAGARRSRESGA